MISEVYAAIVSDAIARVRTMETQYQAGPLVWELIDLLHIRVEFLQSGNLVRGTLTIGHMHLGIGFEGPVFGPGLVQAYEMEEREVVFPRIAVHEDVIERHRRDRNLWREGHDFEDEERHLRNLLRQDDSGLHYIDYLRASLSEFDAPYLDWLGFLQSHKEFVEAGLVNNPNAMVRRKFNWLRNYHNAAIDEALSGFEQNATLADGLRLDELLEARRIEN
ncbi:hypothetical protein [Ruegeria sp. MALMAid1280]|uniref:hypothetical protein n=1 Tax=Ruegeria sp. MALMAid1280 TaxID=3411634 RepID=UPI003BA08C74